MQKKIIFKENFAKIFSFWPIFKMLPKTKILGKIFFKNDFFSHLAHPNIFKCLKNIFGNLKNVAKCLGIYGIYCPDWAKAKFKFSPIGH